MSNWLDRASEISLLNSFDEYMHSDDRDYRTSPIYELEGYIYCYAGTVYVFDEEYSYHTLPSFINNYADGLAYIKRCEHYFKKGTTEGRNSLRGELHRLIMVREE